MPACAATNLPRVDDVLATLQVSSHKCKVMYYTEVLGSEDFRSVFLCALTAFPCIDKWYHVIYDILGLLCVTFLISNMFQFSAHFSFALCCSFTSDIGIDSAYKSLRF